MGAGSTADSGPAQSRDVESTWSRVDTMDTMDRMDYMDIRKDGRVYQAQSAHFAHQVQGVHRIYGVKPSTPPPTRRSGRG